jgi:GST-like protein
MFQMASVGPMLGQTHHFRAYAPEKVEYAINRFSNEARRLYGVMDKQLATNDYIAGKEYTIADMAVWPWLRSHERQGIDLGEFPNVKAWFEAIGNRPAVQRGITVLADRRKPELDQAAREILFGNTQYAKR